MKVLPAALKLEEISLIRDGSQILNEVNLEVLPNEKWVILGPNGSGKTSLLKIAGLYLHPSSGKVSILGNDLGKSDIRKIRHLVGFTSASLADLLRPSLLTRDVVKTAKFGALEPWWNSYDKNDEDLALHQLERLGILGLADQKFGSLSSGEKQRTLIARSLMSNPKILLLDEPASGLDLPGREDLLQSLTLLASDPFSPPVVMVTHHVEEIPEAFTHLFLMKDGACMTSGVISETLTSDNLSSCFNMELELRNFSGRWSAHSIGHQNTSG
jgi:iron complex transport system ATP-binding protein